MNFNFRVSSNPKIDIPPSPQNALNTLNVINLSPNPKP